MTQPNKYIHHKLWREAIIDDKWLYTVKQMTTNYTHLSLYSEEQLLALWFQPVKEEKKAPQRFYDFVKTTPDYVKWWEETLDQFIERIYPMYLKHIPKQELIPLDVEKVIDEIKPCFDWSAVRYYQLREVLSKYGINKSNNLIPLDANDITTHIWELLDCHDYDKLNDIEQILSKYGTTPQKKISNITLNMWANSFHDKSFWEEIYSLVKSFLKDNWLLQE